MTKLIRATSWKVKTEGNSRRIQLFDEEGREVEGKNAYWEGNFSCSHNHLTSLEGAPKIVGGYFNCGNNQLTSLEGAPKIVGGYFNCGHNHLTSLKGAPEVVGGDFGCHNNQLTSLEGAPKIVGGYFYCSHNHLTSLKGAPEVVGGYFDCQNNLLTSLEGAPEIVGGSFYCNKNQLTTLERTYGGFFDCQNNQLTYLKGSPEPYNRVAQVIMENILYTKGILWADGIMSHIVSEKNEVFKVRILGASKDSYVVYRNGFFSHGNTIKEAKESLAYKISDRDTGEYLDWKLDKEYTRVELVQAYRKITGACEAGVRGFIKSNNVPSKATLREAFKITKGAYGSDEFERFFK